MIPHRFFRVLVLSSAFVMAVLLPGASVIQAQTKQLNTWLEELSYLQKISAAELKAQQDALLQIHDGIELWLKLHPSTAIKASTMPPQPWTSDQAKQLVTALRETVQEIQKQDTGNPFDLGVTVISVTAETSPLSPVTDSFDHSDIQNFYAPTVTQTLQYLPGLAIDHKSGRNQAGIMIRGFDTRQVGLYLDGVPIYVPYDGFVDMSRFLTSDIGEVEVAKGYSSPFMGPNGLGGAVNLVTRQPEKKLEGDAIMGTGSGDKLEAGLHIGSRFSKFYLRAGMDWLQTDFFPISGKFTLNSLQPNYDRINSNQRDARYNGRMGWTPRGKDQYVFSYANQKADYGVPPYSGSDTVNNSPRFWLWPYWNKESYYFNSNTGLGESSSIKFRAFYDRYPNGLQGYTDGTLSALKNFSPYDDHSEGASTEFSTRLLPRHMIGASFFIKDDTHRETSTAYATNGVATPQPWRRDRDQMVSFGLQDAIAISSHMRATVGFSADHLNAIHAEDVNSIITGSGKTAVTTYFLAPFNCPGISITTSYSDCLNHVWAYNPLASLSYSIKKSGTFFFTFAQKSHFPTLKDRYSYKNGKAVPNPTILPEHARNWSLGYSQVFARSTVMQIDLFRSDIYDAIQNATIVAEFTNQCPQLVPGFCQKSVNIGKEVHQGIEFTIHSTPLSRLTLDANYSFLNRTMSGPVDMIKVFPTGSPRHRTVGTATIQLPHKAIFLASARYESGTITTNDSGLVVPASKFATADLGLVLPITAGLTLQTGVKNLFDRNFYYQEGFPEPGRNWNLTMRYRF
jgi:iron complex outermembrane recepter protein